MAQPQQLPGHGFDPARLNGLLNRLDRIVTRGKSGWGDLADLLKDGADKDNISKLDIAWENLGTAFIMISAIKSLLDTLQTTLTQHTAQLNALDARVAALERRP